MFRMPDRRGKRGGVAAVVAALCIASGLSLNAAGAETSEVKTYSLLSNADTSAAVVDSDTKEVELGLRFTSSKSGSLSAVRFLKAAGDTSSSHTVSVWDARGKRLATASSTNETASGWQQVQLNSPISIKASSIYVVSYHTRRYVATNNFFSTAKTVSPLTGLRNGGVFTYGASAFPRDTWKASNYWVDVVLSASGVSTTSSTTTAPPASTTSSTTVPPTTTPPTTAPPASTTSTTSTTAPPVTTPPVTTPPGSYKAPAPGVAQKWTPPADWNTDPDPGYGQHPCPAFPAFPDDNCTGFQHTNVSLVPCSGDIEQSNIHLDRCEFQGNLKIIGASNVLITRSKVKGTVNAHWSTDYDFRKLTLMDVEVVAVPEAAIASKNFLFDDGGSATNGSDLKCVRCRIHYVPTGISLGDNSIIKDSYISDVTWGPGAHQAGIGAGQGSGDNSKLIHNNIQCNRWNVNTPGFYHGCSSALSLYPENRLDNVWVEKNLMNTTGGYCTYAGGGDKDGSHNGGTPQWGTNITFIDNRFGTKFNSNCGTAGPVTAFNSDVSSNVWRGNAWTDGREIPVPIWRD